MQKPEFGKVLGMCLDEGHKIELEGQIFDMLSFDKFGNFFDFIHNFKK